MLSLGTGGGESDDEFGEMDYLVQKMREILQEHGWDFTYCRDPLLILIEKEENQDNESED
jgi:hypothetical protein